MTWDCGTGCSHRWTGGPATPSAPLHTPHVPLPPPTSPLHVRTVGDMVALCSALKQIVLHTTLHSVESTPLGGKGTVPVTIHTKKHWWVIDSVCVFSLFTACVVDCMYLYIIYSSSRIIMSVCARSHSSLGVVLFLCILISLCIFHLPDTSSYTKFSPFLEMQVIMLQ